MDGKHNPCEYQRGFGHRCGGGRGPSSFWMHDPEVVFGEIGLKSGNVFLDLGCGAGDFAIYASKIVGNDGAVYAVDVGKQMVDNLVRTASSQGIENIVGIISDITAPLHLKDHCVDVCFVSSVLHTLDLNTVMKSLLEEIRRVMNPDGRLVIIECKKQERSFGPPLHVRLSPEEIEALTTRCGFEKSSFTDLGYNYMIQFTLSRK